MGLITRVRGILLLFWFYRVNDVTCQTNIEAFIGDIVLLPCIYTDFNIFQKNASLYWMDKNDDVVLQIKGNDTKKFRDRVESFPKLYKTGNFSIVIKNVQQSDNSPYDCLIPKMDFHQRVSLIVLGKRAVVAATTPPGSSDGVAATPKSPHMILLSLPLSLLFSRYN